MSENNPTPDAASALAAERAERERLEQQLAQLQQQQASEQVQRELAEIDAAIDKHDYETAAAKLKARLAQRDAEAQRQALVNEAHALAKAHGRDLLSPELAPILALGPTPQTLAALKAFLATAPPAKQPAREPGRTAAPDGATTKEPPAAGNLEGFRERFKKIKNTGNSDAWHKLQRDMRTAGVSIDEL